VVKADFNRLLDTLDPEKKFHSGGR
jgi:hypothetical protein